MAINDKANELLERLENNLREQLLSIKLDRKELEDFLEHSIPKPEPRSVAALSSNSLLEALSNVKEGTSQKETIHLMFKEISKRVRGCGLILLGAGSPYLWPGPKFGLPVGERIGSQRVNINLDNDSVVNKVATTGEMLIIDDLSDTEKKIYQALDVTYPSSLALIPMTINGRIQAVAMADVDEGELTDPATLAIIAGVACSVIEHLPFRERIGFSQFPRYRSGKENIPVAEQEQSADPFPEPETLKTAIPVSTSPAPAPAPAPAPVKKPQPAPPVLKEKPAPAPVKMAPPAPARKPEPVMQPPVTPAPAPEPVKVAAPKPAPAPKPVTPPPVEIDLSSSAVEETVTFNSQTLDNEIQESRTEIDLENFEEPSVEFSFDAEEEKVSDAMDEYELPEISNEDVADLMPTNLQSIKKQKIAIEEPLVEEELELLDSPEPYAEAPQEIDIDISEPAPLPVLETPAPVEMATPVEEPVAEPEVSGFQLEEGQDPDSINTEVVPAENPDESINSDLLKYENIGLQGYNLDNLSGEDKRKHQKAIRFARLLVSEIKLYNEEQVKMGKDKGDLLSRLKEDIERSEILYKQRISDEIRSNSQYFRSELIRQLAGGNESLLGG